MNVFLKLSSQSSLSSGAAELLKLKSKRVDINIYIGFSLTNGTKWCNTQTFLFLIKFIKVYQNGLKEGAVRLKSGLKLVS